MKKLDGLSKEQLIEISHQVADAFYDYKYNEEDQGLVDVYKNQCFWRMA